MELLSQKLLFVNDFIIAATRISRNYCPIFETVPQSIISQKVALRINSAFYATLFLRIGSIHDPITASKLAKVAKLRWLTNDL